MVEKNTILGSRISEAREKVSKNQAELARLIGVSPTHVNRWEKGRVAPGWDYLTQIAKHCNVSLDWLLTGEGLKHLDDLSSHSDKKGVPSRQFDKYEEQIMVLLKGMDVDRKKKVLEMMEKEQLLMNLLGEKDGIKALVEARGILMDLVEEKKKATAKHPIYKEEEKE